MLNFRRSNVLPNRFSASGVLHKFVRRDVHSGRRWEIGLLGPLVVKCWVAKFRVDPFNIESVSRSCYSGAIIWLVGICPL